MRDQCHQADDQFHPCPLQSVSQSVLGQNAAPLIVPEGLAVSHLTWWFLLPLYEYVSVGPFTLLEVGGRRLNSLPKRSIMTQTCVESVMLRQLESCDSCGCQCMDSLTSSNHTNYYPHLLADCLRVWDLVKRSNQSQVSISRELVECHQASLPSQGTFKAVRLAQCFLEII